MTLARFNALPANQAREQLALCCVSDAWISAMESGRPYDTSDGIRHKADAVWASLHERDYLQAFEGHPKIGDVASLREKYAASTQLAAGEQSGVQGAEEATIERLARGNQAYEERFGFIFIVCASGKSAEEMCEILESRLANGRDRELAIAAEEQRKILQLRLEKML